MPTEVILPKVDMDMETGTISAWHVTNGDIVSQGDPLFDIETDKAAMEVESPASGTLHHILASEGDTVPIGRTVAWIFSDDETVPKVAPATEPPTSDSAARSALPATDETSQSPTIAPPVTDKKTRATPAARKLAHAVGLPLDDITGSGPRKRIQSSDVQALFDRNTPTSSASAQVNWDTANAPLSIVETGTGSATPRLLIHGLGADANTWAPVEKELASQGRVLRLELPCHGKSPRQRIDSFAQLAAQVREAFDALNLDSVRLVGHSLGGGLALALADTRVHKVESLTLISPAGLGPQINGDILTGVARATSADSLGPWLRQMVGEPDLITENYAKAAMIARKDPNLRAAQAAMQSAVFPDNTQSFDLKAALHRLRCPTRIIFGKKDQVIPWSHALSAPGQISLNLFDELGHMPQFEAPEQVQALL